MYLLRMPKADENMAEATVVRWLLAPGDRVGKGQDLCECVADKGEFTVWAEEAGSLLRVYAAEQSCVPVGYVLAAVGEAGEELPDVETENAGLMARAREELAAAPGLAGGRSERLRATPAARRLARELGVRLADVAAGIDGPIVREGDVRTFAAGGAEALEGPDGDGS